MLKKAVDLILRWYPNSSL